MCVESLKTRSLARAFATKGRSGRSSQRFDVPIAEVGRRPSPEPTQLAVALDPRGVRECADGPMFTRAETLRVLG
ncbi:hypothetical protein GN956_G4512 [Arapaima gigas]